MKQILNISKICVLFFACVAVWTLILFYSENTPQQNWVSEKMNFKMQPMGATESWKNRTMLAGAQLNLQKYFGHQEMTFGKELDPIKIEWRFKINFEGYVDLIFNRSAETFEGIRLSAQKDHSHYVANSVGKYLEKSHFEAESYEENTWYDASLEEVVEGLLLKVNDKNIFIFKNKKFIAGGVGFRAGLGGAAISKFTAYEKNGEKVQDNFFRLEGFWKAYGINALIFSIIFLLFVIASHFFKKDKLVILKLAQTYLLMFGLLYFCFDFFFYSKVESASIKNENVGISPIYPWMNFENRRYLFFKSWSRLALPAETAGHKYTREPLNYRDIVNCFSTESPCTALDIEQADKLELKKADYNILYYGGSFGRGVGADKIENTFFKITHDFLVQNMPSKTVRSVNYAINISTRDRSKSLLEEQSDIYFKYFIKQKFDLVVFTFVNSQKKTHNFLKIF